jgi:general secretion pathway protein A
MKQAGGTGKEFDAASKSLIHDYTGGVPRQVNNLATACLLQAAAANTHHITEAVLQQTLTEFQLP